MRFVRILGFFQGIGMYIYVIGLLVGGLVARRKDGIYIYRELRYYEIWGQYELIFRVYAGVMPLYQSFTFIGMCFM